MDIAEKIDGILAYIVDFIERMKGYVDKIIEFFIDLRDRIEGLLEYIDTKLHSITDFIAELKQQHEIAA